MEKLLKALIKCKTVSLEANKKEFSEACNIIVKNLKDMDFSVKVYDYNGFKNIFGEKDFNAERTVAFITHYDVVPAGDGWNTDPFEPVKKGDKIFGRGASDDKGGIVVFFSAMQEIEKSSFNIKFFCLSDEEIGGENGIKKLLQEHKELFEDVDVFYILDCTTEGVEIGASGSVSGKIVIRSKGGHAAYPFKYVNAVEHGIVLAEKLMEFGKKEKEHVSKRAIALKNPVSKYVWNRFSVTVFQGGTKSNVIPGYTEIKFNWRLIPEENIDERKKELLKEFEEWKKEMSIDAKLEFFSEFPGYLVDESNEYIKKLKESVNSVIGSYECVVELASTDGNIIFHELKKPVIGFGPLEQDANIHGPNEFVRLSTLEKVKEVLKNFLE